MVLAAVGPDSSFRREMLLSEKKEDNKNGGDKPQIRATNWTTGFLETILSELQQNFEGVNGVISAEDLYKRLIYEHKRLYSGGDSGGEPGKVSKGEDAKQLFLDYIKGRNGELDKQAGTIEIS